MSELTLLLLKFGFLLLLWALVFAVVYALRSDLFGERARRMPEPRQAAAKEGLELPLGSEPLTIGRSSESGLVIRDDYTSTHHARLVLWGDEWVVQDLDSTNGTFLNGVRVNAPTPVPLNTPIKIGTTSFELRR